MKKKKTIKIKNVVLEIPVAVMLIILTLLVLVPVIWMVFSAFKPEKEIISWPPTFIPNSFTLENFTDVQDRIDILRYINSTLHEKVIYSRIYFSIFPDTYYIIIFLCRMFF